LRAIVCMESERDDETGELNCARCGLRGACAQRCLSVYSAITAILLMFHAIVTNDHSPRTAARARSRNCRKCITDLMMPNTGSTVCLRKP